MSDPLVTPTVTSFEEKVVKARRLVELSKLIQDAEGYVNTLNQALPGSIVNTLVETPGNASAYVLLPAAYLVGCAQAYLDGLKAEAAEL